MAHRGQEIVNPRTGQRMRFLRTGAETGGDLLSIESVNPPTGVAEPDHVHPRQESRAAVRSGALRFVVAGAGAARRARARRSRSRPGSPHHFVNDGHEDAVALQEFRPALRTAEMFEVLFGLAERGELDEHGMPSLLRLAVLAPAFADEIRVDPAAVAGAARRLRDPRADRARPRLRGARARLTARGPAPGRTTARSGRSSSAAAQQRGAASRRGRRCDAAPARRSAPSPPRSS